MHDTENLITSAKRIPWNKGKLTGAKPPLRPKHVWAIRTKLQIDQLTRDLALFNLAIDSKLRGCDVVAVKVDDVAPSGYTADRASVRQRVGITLEDGRRSIKPRGRRLAVRLWSTTISWRERSAEVACCCHGGCSRRRRGCGGLVGRSKL